MFIRQSIYKTRSTKFRYAKNITSFLVSQNSFDSKPTFLPGFWIILSWLLIRPSSFSQGHIRMPGFIWYHENWRNLIFHLPNLLLTTPLPQLSMVSASMPHLDFLTLLKGRETSTQPLPLRFAASFHLRTMKFLMSNEILSVGSKF